MARFYGTFDNSTNSALEADTIGNRFQRVSMGGSGATLKSTLEAARIALSAAVYAQLDADSKNGNNGRCFTQDSFARGGGNLTWSDMYYNLEATYNADPRVRPTGAITIANSTDINDDAGSITESLYTDAVNALEAILSQLGVRTRTVYSDFLRLLNVFNDDPLTYIGWDDLTPGQPQSHSLNAVSNPVGPASQTVSLTQNWDRQYPSDDDYIARVRCVVNQVVAGTGGGATSWDSGEITAGAATLDQYTFVTPALQGEGAEYDVEVWVHFRNTTPVTINGTAAYILSSNHIIFGTSA